MIAKNVGNDWNENVNRSLNKLWKNIRLFAIMLQYNV